MRKLILASLIIVVSILVAPDAKACQDCSWGPYVAARCTNAFCGSEGCRVQVLSAGVYCVRWGYCVEDYAVCWMAERGILYIADCKPQQTKRYALVSVKVKRPAA